MRFRLRRTTLQRLRIFEAHGGRCHICRGRIDGVAERWEVEHVIPLALGGEDGDHNIAPAHVACHVRKTAQDRRDIAKAERVRAKHQGARFTRHPLPDGRASLWKRKVGGGRVLRDGDERSDP